MRNAEQDQGGVLDDVDERWHGDQVIGQNHLRQVARILVCFVDNIGKFAFAGDLGWQYGKSV